MAIVGLLIGGTLGFMVSVMGWLFWDMTALAAVSLYFSTSLATGLLMIVFGALRMNETTPEPQTADLC